MGVKLSLNTRDKYRLRVFENMMIMTILATTLEQPSVNGRTILKWIFKKLNKRVKWICLAKNTDYR
jgi:hypothetical protein